MGMFSYVCKGCGQELIERELVRLNGCKGEYDGYGRAGGFEDDTGEVAAWHDRCYKAATQQQRDDETPSKSARNQGFGPAHLEFLPGYAMKAPCKYSITIRGFTKEDQERKDFRETHFVLTTKGWVDATLWEEAEKDGRPLPPHAAEMNLSDPFDAMAQLDSFAQSVNTAHAFVNALRDGAPSVKHVLDSYVIHVFGRQDACVVEGELRWIEGMVYEYQRKEGIKFTYGEVPGWSRTGQYEEGVKYRIGCKTEIIKVPESSKLQVAQVLLEGGTPEQKKEAMEWLKKYACHDQEDPDPDAAHLAAIVASIKHLEGCLEQLKKLAEKYEKSKAKSKK